jgi:hypothetical protein
MHDASSLILLNKPLNELLHVHTVLSDEKRFFNIAVGDHYVYPCQRFSSGNTLEDYNP